MGEALGKLIIYIFLYVSITFSIYLLPGIVGGVVAWDSTVYMSTVTDSTYGIVFGVVSVAMGISCIRYIYRNDLV